MRNRHPIVLRESNMLGLRGVRLLFASGVEAKLSFEFEEVMWKLGFEDYDIVVHEGEDGYTVVLMVRDCLGGLYVSSKTFGKIGLDELVDKADVWITESIRILAQLYSDVCNGDK